MTRPSVNHSLCTSYFSNFLVARLMRSYFLSTKEEKARSFFFTLNRNSNNVRKNTCYFKSHIRRSILHTPSLFNQDSSIRISLYQHKLVQTQHRRTKHYDLEAIGQSWSSSINKEKKCTCPAALSTVHHKSSNSKNKI